MAKLTKEERDALQKQLDDDDAVSEEDDENDDVEVGRADGSYFRGSYRRAKHLGYVTEPEAAPEGGKQGGKQGGKEQGGNVRRFAGGRRVG